MYSFNIGVISSSKKTNVNPVVNAGSGTSVTLPTTSWVLSGSAVTQLGTITAYLWSKTSGPTGGNIITPNSAVTDISGLTVGTYVYKLTATNNFGLTGASNVTVTVLQRTPIPLRYWYVSSSYTGTTQNGGINTPWTSLSQVNTAGNNGTIQAGDAILFKCGDTFYCQDRSYGFRWWRGYGGLNCPTGTQTNPIIFGNYGYGPLPNFLFPYPSVTNYLTKKILTFENTNYIIIDGLQFNDPRYPTVPKVDPSYSITAIMLGEDDPTLKCNNCTVKNCFINNIGNGVEYAGDYNDVSYNTMVNFGQVYAYTTGSYGANAITTTGNYCNIHHNYVSGAWAWAESFGTNGGAVEPFNTNNYNSIMYNTFVDCAGILEFGATSSGSTAYENVCAYNLIINCGSLAYTSGSGAFKIDARNNRFYNNVVIENSESRYSGPNFGVGFENFPTFTGSCNSAPPCTPTPADNMFGAGGTYTASTVYDLKNNIFVCTNPPVLFQSQSAPYTGKTNYSMKVVRADTVTKTTHSYNIYKMISGSSVGYTLDIGEQTQTGPIFLNETGVDPQTWDFHTITKVSGTSVGISTDFAGSGVTNPPLIGIYNT